LAGITSCWRCAPLSAGKATVSANAAVSTLRDNGVVNLAIMFLLEEALLV
jgi:hypothetical protein